MSVLRRDLRFYGSANMPDADGATTGGAVNFAIAIEFSDVSPSGTMNVVSSSASDTACVLTSYGRDSTGTIQSEAKTVGGTTPVAGAQSFERMLKTIASGTTAVGDLAVISNTKVISGHTATAGANAAGITDASIGLQAADGAAVAVGHIIRITNNVPGGVNFQLRRIIAISGDTAYVDRDWGTVPSASTVYDVHQGFLLPLSPNQITQVRRPFYNAAADAGGGSSRIYNEKIFLVDDNTVTAATVAQVSKQVDPSAGTFQFALCSALNDAGTVANRQTAPVSGITAYTTGSAPQTINVPNANQNLPSGAAPNAAGAQGIWLQQTLPAGTAPAKTSFTLRGFGQTT